MKKHILIALLICLITCLWAIPGVTPIIPDEAGQFIYYRDYTFTNETYVGILRYDEGTYCIRYLTCPGKAAEHEITSYVTMNPDSDFIDLTGERVIGAVSADDTEMVNYMHDFLYEFAARRKKVNGIDISEAYIKNEDYAQFGGNVKVVYEAYIPLFNISSIMSETGETLCEAVCTGVITSESDSLFSDFSGVITDKVTASNGSTDGEPDGQWEDYSSGIWVHGDDAVFISSFPAYNEAAFQEQNGFSFMLYFQRYLVSSSGSTYIYLTDADFLADNESIYLVAGSYDAGSGSCARNIRCFGRFEPDESDGIPEEYSCFYFYEMITGQQFFADHEEYLLSFVNEMMP